MGLLLEEPKKVSGHPEKERDVLPPGLVVPLRAEPGYCPPTSGKPPAFIQELYLFDMDGLCPGLSEGSAFGDTVVSQPYLSHKSLPQWSEALGASDTGPSNGSQQVWCPSAGWKGSASQGHTDRCTSRERKSPSYFVNTLKQFKNKITVVKNTDSTELIPPT